MMNTRTIAGLGMLLLAAGLLTIYFLDIDFSSLSSEIENQDKPSYSLAPTPTENDPGPRDVVSFLENYNATYKNLWTDAEAARFAYAANQTKALSINEINSRRLLYDYTGSSSVIEVLRQYRGRLDLTRLQDRQIERAWRLAAMYPKTSADDVILLMDLNVALTDSLLEVHCNKEPVDGLGQHPNLSDLSVGLSSSTDPDERLKIWESAQNLGLKIKDTLVQTRDLRNKLAREMGYTSYFALAANRYGMESEELIQLLDEITREVSPLYKQLHCIFKHETSSIYSSEVPRLLPAHWIPDNKGSVWAIAGITDAIPARMDSLFLNIQPQWILEQAENFHTSLGFSPLPLGFWGRSNLYPLAENSENIKSPLSQTWHMDLDQDVRATMNVSPNFSSYMDAHRILAQTYYHLSYSRDEVPATLRQGANPAFVPALGKLMELAAGSAPALMDAGLISPGKSFESIEILFYQAMHGSIMQIPKLCGTLAHWEYDLYENDLPRHLFNTRWWEYSEKYQGIESSSQRGEMDCSPAIQNDVINNPGEGMDAALSLVIAHQLHRYICKNILNEDVRLANYRGRKEVGRYLQSVMQLGATRDWMQVMREATGEELSSEALLEYYQPLSVWLTEQNASREEDFSLVEETQSP